MLPMILTSPYHTPVLLPQVIAGLKIEPGKKYIDATIGGGGYAFEILKRGGIVLGIDADQDAIDYVKKILVSDYPNIRLVQGNFADLKDIAKRHGFDKVAGILFDLGMSTYQLKHSGRGFSFETDEPLDMRMDKHQGVTAADIINTYSRERLDEIFTKYSEELHSRAIADAIVFRRSLRGPILRTDNLVGIIARALDRIYDTTIKEHKIKLYYQTYARIFQALRIVVNSELDNLNKGLLQTVALLDKEGRVAVLTYHSLEDRIVKHFYRQQARENHLKIITPKPIRATREEIKKNPKARLAKLRIAEKI